MSLRFTEKYPEVAASLSIEVKRTLYSGKSPFQKIEVFDTEKFGLMLVIDGCIMLTQRDEFIYHEMIAHVPLCVHPSPKRVLVIGGGDGGTVREIFKHPGIERVVMVEIDAMVVQASLSYVLARVYLYKFGRGIAEKKKKYFEML